jgi:peptide chain release factor 3
VARLRRLPIFTFVNKLDRPAISPLEICDQIESEFGIQCCPVLWPVGSGDRFKGVLERRTGRVHLFEKGARGKVAEMVGEADLHSPDLAAMLGDDELHAQLLEDAEILDELYPPLDVGKIATGAQTPVFFGSAMTNFGVQLFLDAFMELGLPPAPRAVDSGEGAPSDFENGAIGADASVVEPTHAEFSGFVFKLQANLDPRHRDRMAFVRVCSGTFVPGLRVKHSRLKGKELTLSQVQTISGNDRATLDEACFPGDVIGINNPAGTFAIGDTIYTGSERISYTKIPSFSPEVFALCSNPTPSKYKAFSKGLEQLLDEGAVQRLRERGDDMSAAAGSMPILAAVGPLQFEVVASRLQAEYGVDVSLERLPFASARWAMAGWAAVDKAKADGKLLGVRMLEDTYSRPVLLFPSEWKLNAVLAECTEPLQLRPFAVAPDVEERRRK